MLFMDQLYTTSRRQKDIPGREKMRRQGVWKARLVREVIKIPHWVKKGKECGFDLGVYGTNLKKRFQANNIVQYKTEQTKNWTKTNSLFCRVSYIM